MRVAVAAPFCPDAPMTRGEMAIALLKANTAELRASRPARASSSTYPVPRIRAVDRAVLQGGDHRRLQQNSRSPLLPGRPLTRGQPAVFLTKTFDFPM